jgi:hypothetical protein
MVRGLAGPRLLDLVALTQEPPQVISTFIAMKGPIERWVELKEYL